jgi:hypothetical protein
MGAARSAAHKLAPVDFLWQDSHRVSFDGLGQLLSTGAADKVSTVHTNIHVTFAEHARLAHRLRDIQTLPYVVVANPHLAHVYESYLQAFERFRRVPKIRSLEDNDRYCRVLEETLKEHATVIPRLAIGVLEVRNLMKPDETDKFMTTMLRAVCAIKQFSCAFADTSSAYRGELSQSNTLPLQKHSTHHGTFRMRKRPTIRKQLERFSCDATQKRSLSHAAKLRRS